MSGTSGIRGVSGVSEREQVEESRLTRDRFLFSRTISRDARFWGKKERGSRPGRLPANDTA